MTVKDFAGGFNFSIPVSTPSPAWSPNCMRLIKHNRMQASSTRTFALAVSVTALFVSASSCNNNASNQRTADSAATATPAPRLTDSTAKAAAYSFIDACVESSKASRPDQAKAFAYCKCMEAQIRQKYGNTDSASVVALQQDTSTLKSFLQNCQ